MKSTPDEAQMLCGLSLYDNLPPLYAPSDQIMAFTDGLGQPMTGTIKLHAMDDRGATYYIIEATDGSGNYIVPFERVSI